MRLANTVLIGVGMLLFMAVSPAAADGAGASAERARTLVMGRISDDPRKTIPRLEGFAGYLVSHLEAEGIVHGEAVVARDARQMIEYLRDGVVDLVSESSMTSLYMEEQGVARLFLREWKQGVSEYFSIFLTRNAGDIRTLSDLVGRKIVFEDRGSTTGFLLPLAAIRAAGLSAVEIGGPNDAVPPGSVAYLFAGSEINIGLWVARGVADAGAMSNLDWLDTDRVPAAVHGVVTVFHETSPVLRSVLLVRAGLAENLQQRIEDVLLSAHEDPAAAEVLSKYYHVERYDRFEGVAQKSLDEARTVFARIRNEIK